MQLTVALGASAWALPQEKAVPSGLPMWSSVTVYWAEGNVTLPVFVIVYV